MDFQAPAPGAGAGGRGCFNCMYMSFLQSSLLSNIPIIDWRTDFGNQRHEYHPDTERQMPPRHVTLHMLMAEAQTISFISIAHILKSILSHL